MTRSKCLQSSLSMVKVRPELNATPRRGKKTAGTPLRLYPSAAGSPDCARKAVSLSSWQASQSLTSMIASTSLSHHTREIVSGGFLGLREQSIRIHLSWFIHSIRAVLLIILIATMSTVYSAKIFLNDSLVGPPYLPRRPLYLCPSQQEQLLSHEVRILHIPLSPSHSSHWEMKIPCRTSAVHLPTSTFSRLPFVPLPCNPRGRSHPP